MNIKLTNKAVQNLESAVRCAYELGGVVVEDDALTALVNQILEDAPMDQLVEEVLAMD